MGLGQGREDGKWSCGLRDYTGTTRGSPSFERKSILKQKSTPTVYKLKY